VAGTEIPVTEQHTFGAWAPVGESAILARICSVCGKKEEMTCEHVVTDIKDAAEANCGGGYTGDTYCLVCGIKIADGEKLPAVGEHTWGEWTVVDGSAVEVRECSVCHMSDERESQSCLHQTTEIRDAVTADCRGGYTGDTYCTVCGELVADGEEIAPVGDHDFGEWTLVEGTSNQTRTCSKCDTVEQRTCPHAQTEIRDQKADGCGGGYTGDEYCQTCGAKVKSGTATNPVGDHIYGEWVAVEGTDKERHECTVCGHTQERTAPCYHQNTEIRDAKQPTEAVDGYTGDTYCADCGELVSLGEVIAATGTEESTTKNNNVQIVVSGCESSISGGAVIIVSSICAIAFLKKRKKH
jgi:hypothetical protein